MSTNQTETEYGPWNPGVESAIPPELVPLATIFRQENTFSSLSELRELSGYSGIPIEELAVFRPERLVMHEVLIRVIADLNVPDGARYEDLGKNFRLMTSAILSKYIDPLMEEVKQLYTEWRRQISEQVDAELEACLRPPAPATAPAGLLSRFGFRSRKQPPAPAQSPEERGISIVDEWQRKAAVAATALERNVCEALARAGLALLKKYALLPSGKEMFAGLAIPLASNAYCAEAIAAYLDPHFRQAVAEEGYRFLPAQTHPLIMNVKGASASGKSTLRPLQKQLAIRLGIPWFEIALVSPDIWRKFLLDYDSLGPARRYAGSLTGQEFTIIDRKLDQHLFEKGEKMQLPHLLIDRFRFDSFATERSDCGPFMERFGDHLYVFFMITPPEATVERAWERGERFGRYKAVDDLLYHNVEAYAGMPRLFLSWAGSKHKRIHFEFLDNSVPKGTTPRTVAYGTNKELNVLDIKSLIDIDRFKKIRISARRPEDVYNPALLAPEMNTEFLRKCARAFPVINFAEADTGRIYAKALDGNLKQSGTEPCDPDVKAGLEAVSSEFFRHSRCAADELGELRPGDAPTLGAWGACISAIRDETASGAELEPATAVPA